MLVLSGLAVLQLQFLTDNNAGSTSDCYAGPAANAERVRSFAFELQS